MHVIQRPKADQDYVTNAENVKLHEIKASIAHSEQLKRMKRTNGRA